MAVHWDLKWLSVDSGQLWVRLLLDIGFGSDSCVSRRSLGSGSWVSQRSLVALTFTVVCGFLSLIARKENFRVALVASSYCSGWGCWSTRV